MSTLLIQIRAIGKPLPLPIIEDLKSDQRKFPICGLFCVCQLLSSRIRVANVTYVNLSLLWSSTKPIKNRCVTFGCTELSLYQSWQSLWYADRGYNFTVFNSMPVDVPLFFVYIYLLLPQVFFFSFGFSHQPWNLQIGLRPSQIESWRSYRGEANIDVDKNVDGEGPAMAMEARSDHKLPYIQMLSNLLLRMRAIKNSQMCEHVLTGCGSVQLGPSKWTPGRPTPRRNARYLICTPVSSISSDWQSLWP